MWLGGRRGGEKGGKEGRQEVCMVEQQGTRLSSEKAFGKWILWPQPSADTMWSG
jgi:hypothetical protein